MRYRRIALYILTVYLTGCAIPPVPPEVRSAEELEKDLWRTGASIYAPREYDAYAAGIRRARQSYEKENLKLGWFRSYDTVRNDFKTVLDSGNALLSRIRTYKKERLSVIQTDADWLEKRLATLDEITISVNERGKARGCLSKAELLLKEAVLMAGQEKYDEAEKNLKAARVYIREAENACRSLLSRYMDPARIRLWRRQADETVAESDAKGIPVLVVSKLERRMTLYKNGRAAAEYEVGLGFNGLSDKKHAGDDATPEGRYRVTKKNASSRYYKALLINYPNEEDKQQFAEAKRRGEIPRSVGIGSLIEIHGGGKDSLTLGCVSVDDRVMDELFQIVSVGTPVTIVGTLENDSTIIKAIRNE